MAGSERVRQLDDGRWVDADGFVGLTEPGTGARRYPPADFEFGPAVGERLPAIVLEDGNGDIVDVHAHRGGRRAVVSFQRSVVW